MSDRPDPSLAWERTALAWTRTGLAAIAVGALALKVFPPADLMGRHLLGVGLFALGGWALGRAQRRAQGLVASGRAHRWFTTAMVAAATGAAVAVAIP